MHRKWLPEDYCEVCDKETKHEQVDIDYDVWSVLQCTECLILKPGDKEEPDVWSEKC